MTLFSRNRLQVCANRERCLKSFAAVYVPNAGVAKIPPVLSSRAVRIIACDQVLGGKKLCRLQTEDHFLITNAPEEICVSSLKH